MAAVAISFAVALLSCLSTATSALIRFNASEYNVSEGDGFVVVCLEVNSNETQSSINSVTVFTTSDSANSGELATLVNYNVTSPLLITSLIKILTNVYTRFHCTDHCLSINVFVSIISMNIYIFPN